MKNILAVFAVVLFLSYPAMAAETAPAPTTLKVENAYAFATAPEQKNGAIFLTINGDAQNADKLTGAATDKSEVVELHATTIEYDQMKMVHAHHIDIPAAKAVVFEPSGYHVMLIGLKSPLNAGETFPLTLTFEKAGAIEVPVTITAPGTKPGDQSAEQPKVQDAADPHAGHDMSGHDH
jgi:copper(I)-binding protein